MADSTVLRIQRHPKYLELRSKRNSLGALLTVLMLLAYYGYVALIAFNKPFLATPLGAGVTTIGVPIGMAVIVFTILITGYYVYRANKEFDAMTAALLKEVQQ